MSTEPTPSRRSRSELRELVVSAAIDLIRTEGLGVVSTTLTYQRVFEHLEATKGIRVTRASVHERIWDSQSDFQNAVLLRANHWETTTGETLDHALEAFARTDGLSPWLRLREMTRVSATHALAAAESDPLYYSWVGATMSMAKDSNVDAAKMRDLADATAAAYAEIDDRIIGLLVSLANVLGFRPKANLFRDPDSGLQLIARLGVALSEGASVRTRFDPRQLPDRILPTGPDGEDQTWSEFALGYWALLQAFIEIDPEVHPDLVD